MELKSIREIKGKITVVSGLHIGSGEGQFGIAGADEPVVRLPNGEPYIPGSSLKGKIRSLLELASGLMVRTGGRPLDAEILQCEDLTEAERGRALTLLRLFGSRDVIGVEAVGPSRVLFRDARLIKGDGLFQLDLIETKGENRINRIRGRSESSRTVERIQPGSQFALVVVLRSFLEDDDSDLYETLIKGLKLLSFDALGASGSRGYGAISLSLEGDAGDSLASVSLSGGVFA